MIPKINSAHGSDTRNIINRAIEVLNQQGKAMQDLVAEGQLTEEQYAELITTINSLIKSGDIDMSDLTPEFKGEIEGFNSRLAQKANKEELQALASGAPKGVFSTVAKLEASHPNGAEGIYVVKDNGEWYFWNGLKWESGGVYQSTLEVIEKPFPFRAEKNSDGEAIVQGSGSGYIWGHTDNLVFTSDGSMSLGGLTITVNKGKFTLNGTLTENIYIKLSNGLDMNLGSAKAEWLNDSLPYDGEYTGEISPILLFSLLVRGKNNTNLYDSSATKTVTMVDASYIYVFIPATAENPKTFDNEEFSIQFRKSGTPTTTDEPNNTVINVPEPGTYGMVTEKNQQFELMGNYTGKFIVKEPITFSQVAKTGDYNDLKNLPNQKNGIFYNSDFTNGVIDIYIPANDHNSVYMHYQLKHEVLPYTNGGNYQNYDGWRSYKLFTSSYANGVFTDILEIVNVGAWEMAIGIDGLSDFHGTYHGYEKKLSTNFLVDNIENKDSSSGWVDSVTFTQVSQLIKHGTESEAICDCGRMYTYNQDGLVLTQTVDWLQSLKIDRGYTTMLPIKRTVNADGTGEQITDRVIADCDMATYDISLVGHDTPISNIDYSKPKNVRSLLLYGKTSNIFADVKILDNKNSEGARMSVAKEPSYNKVYYMQVPRNHQTTIGEHWYTKTHYKIGMN